MVVLKIDVLVFRLHLLALIFVKYMLTLQVPIPYPISSEKIMDV